jgi:hypothetical protein
LTNVVSTLTGSPRKEAMLATLVSALVVCMMKVPPPCTGCPASGVMRTPMLVGTTSAYSQPCFSSIFICRTPSTLSDQSGIADVALD